MLLSLGSVNGQNGESKMVAPECSGPDLQDRGALYIIAHPKSEVTQFVQVGWAFSHDARARKACGSLEQRLGRPQ